MGYNYVKLYKDYRVDGGWDCGCSCFFLNFPKYDILLSLIFIYGRQNASSRILLISIITVYTE